LKAIYENYKAKSHQGAKTIKDEMLQEQYQEDEIEPEFIIIIVRHYKMLYTEENGIVL
jgi:hypothetical protein